MYGFFLYIYISNMTKDWSAIVIKARIKTRPIKQWSVGREYRKRPKRAFDKNNIEIPFSQRTVYWGEKIHPLQLDVNKLPDELKQ